MLIFKNSQIEVKDKNENIIITFRKPYRIYIPKEDKNRIDMEIVRLNKIKQLNNRKFLYQKTIGKMFSVSRQMINRRIMVEKREGIISLLQGDWEKSKLTNSVEKRITEMICENVFLSAEQIREDLIKEGTVNKISTGSIYNGIKNMDGQYVIKLLREKVEKSKPEIHMSSRYIIDKLMKIVVELLEMINTKNFSKLKANENDIKNILENYKRIPKSNKMNEKRQWDCYSPRKKLSRDIKRKDNYLKMIFNFLVKKAICCPDCLSEDVKFLFKRNRSPLNEKGERYQDVSRIYKCNNRGCKTKWFTLTPKGVELYAHASTKLKEKAFELLFHVRGTYRRVSDYLRTINIPVHFVTLMRWVKKAGEEYIDTLKLQNKIFAQSICIDEKWVKVRNLWRYVFVAVDNLADDLLDAELYSNNGKKEIKLFLLKLKSMGIYPKVIITDLLNGYGKVIKEIYPNAYHHECILHAGRAARALVYKYFQGEAYKKLRKKLIKKIQWFFKSEDKDTVNERWEKLQLLKDKYGDMTKPMLKLLGRYMPKFIYAIEHPEIPKTSNGAERVIKELANKYQNMLGYSSFYVAQFMIKVFVIYYRMKKFSSGKFKGKSPVEIKGLSFKKLKWTDILFAHFS